MCIPNVNTGCIKVTCHDDILEQWDHFTSIVGSRTIFRLETLGGVLMTDIIEVHESYV